MDYLKYPVLYVDDNESNRVVAENSLGREFTLLVANSGREALDVLASQFVAVLLTDQRMPEITGVDLAEMTHAKYPDITRIIITAYSDIDITIDAINRGRVNRFVKKPWSFEELSVILKESISSYYNTQLVKRLQEKLISVDRVATLGVMVSGIVHDLRQPLSQILPFLGLAKDNIQEIIKLNPEGRTAELLKALEQDIDDATTGAEMLKMFTNSLLDQVRNKPIEKEPLDLKEVAKGATSLVRCSVHERAQLEVEVPAEPVDMRGCSSRLSQLIINLLLNASHAIAPGTPWDNTVSLRLKPSADEVLIEVEDTGMGISPENQKKIFTPFFSTKGAEGSGLGLAICKQSVEAHRGTIKVSSIVGRGTCFKIRLPRQLPQER